MRDLSVNEVMEISGGGIWGDKVSGALSEAVKWGTFGSVVVAALKPSFAGLIQGFGVGAVCGVAKFGVDLAAHTYNVY